MNDTARLIGQAQTLSRAADTREADRFAGIGQLLVERVAEQGERDFLRYFDDDGGERTVLSWRAFAARVEAAAAFLASRGIGPGDCIATLAYNHPVGAVLLFAAWRLNAIVAPQNASEDDARIAFILGDADAKLVIAHPAYLERAKKIVAAGVSTGWRGAPVLAFGDIPEETAQPAPAPAGGMDREALLVYTSGTTGNPKGVMLTQRNLIVNAFGTARWHGLDAESRAMCVLPIHHVNGIVVTLMTPLAVGASVVLCRGFKASVFWKRLAEEGVRVVSTVPTILQYLCEADEDISALDLENFRYPICGAGTLAVALVERFEARFGFRVMHGYGLSETTAFACTLPVDLDEAAHRRWLRDLGYPSIGTPLAHCEMAIHDADGRELPSGERGEIVVRGPYVMAGYHHRPDANAETFKHGWFRSGDEGFCEIDAQGRPFFFITGRLKELINRGGVKYSPFEIEEVLLAIPGVKVGLAIAFDNEWYGEEVGAYVVRETGAALDEARVLSACREKMPFAKCPKAVAFGEEIPVTTTGKYQRLKLKGLFAMHAKTQFRP